jgi:molybdenum cofactor cytidylyltransferase
VIFASLPAGEAIGAVLAHSVAAGAVLLKKGRILTSDDAALLATAGVGAVTVAKLETGDVAEDVAALSVAGAIAGDHIAVAAPATGRCNLTAAAAGVVCLDAERLDRINAVDEAITVATVAPYAAVAAGDIVATIKIIPFAASQAAVEICREIAAGAEAPLRLASFRQHRLGLIQTHTAGVKPGVLAKTREVTRARIAALGSELVADRIVAHDEVSVAGALRALAEAGCEPILLLGGTAIADRRDIIPSAIAAAGGEVVHFGMPVDPGNLLLIGSWRDRRLVGLPGCARSPKLNGFDWVLQRLLARLPVGRREIVRMGVGGLLADIPSRPMPRAATAAATTEVAEVRPAPPGPVAALVLAAGAGRRFGGNKLLARFRGQPLVRWPVAAARGSCARPVVVVVGEHAREIELKLTDQSGVIFVHNDHHRDGLSTSLRAGIAALPPDVAGVIVLLGDMPLVSVSDINRLIAAFDPMAGRSICVPEFDGQRGNPVLWGREHFADLAAVTGDRGGGSLLAAQPGRMHRVAMPSASVLIDIDNREALQRASSLAPELP